MVAAVCLMYLPEEDATVFAKVQRVAVLLLHGVVLLQGEIHQLPVHVVVLRQNQVPTELKMYERST